MAKTGIRWLVYDNLMRVKWLRKLHDILQPYAKARSILAVVIAIGALSLVVEPWAVVVMRSLVLAVSAIAAFFAVWDFAVRWTDSQVGASKRDINFSELLVKPLLPTEARPANVAHAQEDVSLAARLEHEAFSMYGTTSEDVRAERIKKWFPNCCKSIYFMLRRETEIGYSIIIPVSELDAQRYRDGLMKEWGFVPDQSPEGPTIFYAQSLYLKRELQNQTECLGLAQRVFFQHIANFFPEGSYRPFCILADSETWHGARFLLNLGFTVAGKSADGRPIYQLDLRQPYQLNDDGRVSQSVFKTMVAANLSATRSG